MDGDFQLDEILKRRNFQLKKEQEILRRKNDEKKKFEEKTKIKIETSILNFKKEMQKEIFETRKKELMADSETVFFKIKSLAPSLLQKSHIPASDKIILHQSMLNKIENEFSKEISFPIIFKIQKASEINKSTHCGVLEFSASEESEVILPTRIWKQLGFPFPATNFHAVVDLECKRLAKCSFCKLHVFGKLKEISQKFADFRSEIEFALRSSTTLTIGDVFEIQEISMSVLDLKPSKEVCIIDTDIELLLEFDDVILKENKDAGIFREIDFDENLEISSGNSLINCKVPKEDLLVTVKAKNIRSPQNAPKIFVSVFPRKVVSQTDFDFCGEIDQFSFSEEISVHVQINPNLLASEDSLEVFMLVVSEDNVELSVKKFPADTNILKDGNSQGICKNCLREISSKSLTLHELHCKKTRFFCQTCNKTVKKIFEKFHAHCKICQKNSLSFALDEHERNFHAPLDCPFCLQSVSDRTTLVYEHYRKCEKFPVSCRFCGISTIRGNFSLMDAKDRFMEMKSVHEAECGNRTEICSICLRVCRLKDFQVHFLANHPEIQWGAKKI